VVRCGVLNQLLGFSRFIGTVAVIFAALLALWAVGAALSPWVVAAIVAFGAIATIPRIGRVALQVLCAGIIALLGLVGFNIALGWAVELLPDRLISPDARLPIALGLAIAVAVFWATAYFYLRAIWVGALAPGWLSKPVLTWTQIPSGRWPRGWSLLASGLLAVLVVVGLPPLIAEIRAHNAPEPRLLPTRIGDELDVSIIAVGPLPEAEDIPPDPSRLGFLPAFAQAVDLDVRFTVGFAKGKGVHWTRTGIRDESEARAALSQPESPAVPRPKRRPDADGLIVLVVDGTPAVVPEPADLEDVDGTVDEVERWRSIALAAGGRATPVVALLQTTNEARLRKWVSFEDVGQVVSVQHFAAQTVTEAAVRLGIGTPDALDDYELAMRHRPILLFDRAEPVPRPLSIEALFEGGHVRQCADLQSAGTCGEDPVMHPADLKSPGMHLVIDPPDLNLLRLARDELEAWKQGRQSMPTGTSDAANPPTPAPGSPDAPPWGAPPPGTPPTLPPGTAGGSDGAPLLGAGSRLYFNVVSVQIGVRRLVYLDYWWYLADNPTGAVKGAVCGAGMVILGVTCFDHESDWEGVTVVLERKGDNPDPIAVQYAQHESVVRYAWSALRAYWDGEEALDDVFSRLPDYTERPVVWIARGTHAAYARGCTTQCRQVAAKLEERPHDGALPWVGNDTAVCQRVSCLLPLPTAAGGRLAASWNAFAGPWGRRRCWATYYCDSAEPPPAPGQQDRYLDPARYDGTAKVTDPEGGFEEGQAPG
jgi:hypothetical protein